MRETLYVNSSLVASHVKLVGIGNGTAAIQPLEGGVELFHIGENAPPMTIQDVTLQGRTHLAGSQLTLHRCNVKHVTSEGDGGALIVTGGELHAANTVFSSNTATANGGAASISGGTTAFATCTFTDNHAGGDGGALHVNGGSVVMSDGTTLTGNQAAQQGAAIFLADGHVEYQLPALPGHWIHAVCGGSKQVLDLGPVNGAYPYPFPPLKSNTFEIAAIFFYPNAAHLIAYRPKPVSAALALLQAALFLSLYRRTEQYIQ